MFLRRARLPGTELPQERDDFRMNRHRAPAYCLSMISAQTPRVCLPRKDPYPPRRLRAGQAFSGSCRSQNREGQEAYIAKIDLDSMSIEELAALQHRAIEKLGDEVVQQQAELAAESERLSHYC